MEPYQNGSGAGQPDVVNNSWGGSGGQNWYQSYVQNWRSAGIFPAFSNGNAGPACGTAGSPGDYPESFASGATTSADAIASNSGTSMACPHTAASAALLWAARGALRGNIGETEALLRQNATPLTTPETCGGVPGSAVPNNTYGYGLLNVKAAADAGGGTVNTPPVATNLSPAEGTQVSCGVAVNCTATALDAEQGNLTSSIVWLRGGTQLQAGGTLSHTFSCATETGPQAVMASVTGSQGATDTDTRTVNVVNPAVPAALKARVSGTTVKLAWVANSSGEPGFRVERKPKTGTMWAAVGTAAADTATYSDTGLTKGNYQYRVFAVNESAASLPSNTANARVR